MEEKDRLNKEDEINKEEEANKKEENISSDEQDKEMQDLVEEAAKAAAMAAETDEEAEEENPDEAANKKIQDLNDRLIRNMAEFDNYRKRTEKEKLAMFDMGAKNIAEKLLPVIDNFERGLMSVPEDKEAKAFFEGMDMIYKQLIKNLSEAGVTPIDCLGKEFDPNFHNAVMHIEDETVGENLIIEELQKGYMYKDAVLRHSMVKVAN